MFTVYSYLNKGISHGCLLTPIYTVVARVQVSLVAVKIYNLQAKGAVGFIYPQLLQAMRECGLVVGTYLCMIKR